MSNLRDIKRRIKSVRNTSQITKAMQMVASAKMRRAQEQALRGRVFISALASVFRHLRDSITEGGLDLMKINPKGKALYIIVNTDRGLCGGLNSNLFKEVLGICPADADYITIGAKLNPQLTRVGRNLRASFTLPDGFSDGDLKPILDFIRKGVVEGSYDRVCVAYQKFINIMVQRPQIVQLLPIMPEDLLELAGDKEDIAEGDLPNYILEPSPVKLLNTILPLYFSYRLTQMVLEGKASEQSARMVAMKAATENAKTLIGDLTLEYNKARQTQITNELLEITTAMKAME